MCWFRFPLLIPPEILEPVRRQRRVDRGAGYRPMAERSLDCPGVVALVGKGVAAGVAEHVRMGLEIEAGAGCGALDHPGKAGRRERGSPLGDEDEGRRLTLALEPPKCPEFVAN